MSKLFNEASLVMIPSAYKDGKLYSIKPIPEFGSEILTQPVDIDTDFNANSGGVIVDANTFTTAGGTFDGIIAYNMLVVGKQYRLEIQGSTTSSGFTIGNGSGAGNEYGRGFGVHYFTAVNVRLWIRQTTAGTTDITTFSIKEVSNIGDFTFSRGSNLAATRVDVNGLIEKGRENLLLQSNQFDTTWVLKHGATLTSGIQDPNGGNNAWELNFSTTSGSRIEQQITTSSGKLYVFSFYARVASGTLNISVGAVGSLKTKTLTTEWQRVEVYGTAAANSFPQIRDLSTDANTIQIYNAQFELGLAATDYIETGASTAQAGILEDMPRLDYSGGASCPALLLEPQRLNKLTHSEYFGGYQLSNATIETNSTTSPQGVKNASTLEANGNGTSYMQFSVTAVSGDRVVSVFAKEDDNSFIQILNTGDGNLFANFDLSDGSVGTIGSGTTASIEDYGNGWYRCICVWDSAETINQSDRIYLVENDSGGYADGHTFPSGTGVFLWGLQREDNVSYPTSYIPTYGSSVTRSVDSCLTDSYTFGSEAFTLFFEHDPIPTGSNGQMMLLYVNPLDFYFRYTSDLRLNIWNQDGGQTILNADIGRNNKHKILMVYDGVGSTDIYIDGVKEKSGYSYTFPDAPYDIRLNPSSVVSGNIPFNINQIVVFDTALTDSECIALTE